MASLWAFVTSTPTSSSLPTGSGRALTPHLCSRNGARLLRFDHDQIKVLKPHGQIKVLKPRRAGARLDLTDVSTMTISREEGSDR